MTTRKRRLATLCLLAPAAAGLGQTGVYAAQEEADGAIQKLKDQVVVYGTKQSTAQKAQEVPVQVTALGSEQLEARQVVTLDDLGFAAPNVQLDSAGVNPGVQNFSIRGLGINGSAPSVDPTVGVFVDGVYLGVIYGSVTDTFDLESVEILRGPQGVLFGRNVTGGAVLLRSRRPDGETRVRGKLGFEQGPQWTGAASVEGGLVEDTLAGKMSFMYKDDSGYFENPTIGRDTGKQETVFFRPTLVFTPGDFFDTTLIFEYGDIDGDGTVPQFADGASPGAPNDRIVTVADNPGFLDLKWKQLTLESNLELWGGQVTNIFGWRTVDSASASDTDGSAADLFVLTALTDQYQFSDELRYNGPITPWWQLTAGAYYFTQDVSYRETRSIAGGAIQVAGGGDQRHDVVGVFFNNDLELSRDLTLIAGLRYTYEKKDADIFPFGACDFAMLTCLATFSDNPTYSNLTPKIGLTWRASDDVLLYAHWTRGFRSGGFNLRVNPNTFAGPTDEESQDSYEVGVKSSFLDDNIRMNAAFFWNDVSDLQRTVLSTDPAFGVGQVIANTADARIAGFEGDADFLVSDNFLISASVGYLDGDYKSVLLDISQDGVVDNADINLMIPRLSKWTTSIAGTYDVHLGEYGVLSLRAEHSYRSETFFDDANMGLLPAYHIVNAGVSFQPPGERWELTVYGKNLTDEAVLGGNAPLPFGPAAPYVAPLKEGRRIGVELNFEM